MPVLLVGANPAISLFDGDRVTAFACVWVADWSVRGTGTAVILWHDGTVRVLGENAALAAWLERDFTRHFPEVAGLPWPEPRVEVTPVKLDLDLEHMRAEAGNIVIEAGDVLGRRTYATDEFDLGGVHHGLSLVLAPAATASIRVDGTELAGEVRVGGTPERPSSSAFLTLAEVWSAA